MVVVETVIKQLNEATDDPSRSSFFVTEAIDTLSNGSGCLMDLACGELSYIRDQLAVYLETQDIDIINDCIFELEVFDNSSPDFFIN